MCGGGEFDLDFADESVVRNRNARPNESDDNDENMVIQKNATKTHKAWTARRILRRATVTKHRLGEARGRELEGEGVG